MARRGAGQGGMGQELPTAYVGAGIGRDVVLERRLDRRRRERAAVAEVVAEWPEAVPHGPVLPT